MMQTQDTQQEILMELAFFHGNLESFVRRPTPELRNHLLSKIGKLPEWVQNYQIREES
jgi:hypothetical protein